MSAYKLTILALMTLVLTVHSIEYDADFWEGFDSEEPYNHTWSDIPDLIDNKTVSWWFNETRYFL